MQQLASGRNRRLAQQMERRPSVAAALRRVRMFFIDFYITNCD